MLGESCTEHICHSPGAADGYVFSKAMKNHQEIFFKFHNKLRRFIPYSFTYYKEFIYVTGFSVLENDIKTLNLSGIKDLKLS